MRKLIVLAAPLALSFAAPLFGAYPGLAPNQSILSGLKDTSNFSSSTTQYGFSLSNGALDPALYINSIDLVPGVGYDANIGLSAAECLVVEDAVNGVAAAKSAGMQCLALTTSFSPEQLIGADWIAPTLAEAPGWEELGIGS